VPHDQSRLEYSGLGRYRVKGRPKYRGKDIEVEIEEDFETDLATSPRIFWAWVPPFGAYEAAAILHDYLLKLLERYYKAMQARITKDGWLGVHDVPKPPVSSVDADGWFRRVMRESGVGFVKRWSMWTAVRWAALFSDYRRAGWLCWPEAPLVVLISVVWLIVAIAAAVGIHLTVDLVWSWIT
jgi:hypothetical protein